MLKKKCNATASHAVCESVAMGETLTGCISSEDNLVDFLTKVVTGHKQKHFVSLVLYDIYDGDIQQWVIKFFLCTSKMFYVLIM